MMMVGNGYCMAKSSGVYAGEVHNPFLPDSIAGKCLVRMQPFFVVVVAAL